jgi:hypothetical protein
MVTSRNAAKRLILHAGSGDPGLRNANSEIVNTNQKVKRAAPGGEGLVIDYFDEGAVTDYLHHFDSVFSSTGFPFSPRAWYHDSYEAYQANWSDRFPGRFRELAGYELAHAIPILLDTLDPSRPLVVHDYRKTLADLLYTEFASTWTGWCRASGTRSRYQAHGSPGNLLDLYALSDIPETESFGCSNFPIPKLINDPDYEESRFGRPSPMMMKFASSPAHLLDKPLVSSETGTWLANHFKVTLSQVKPQVDELFISGINHVFYHGTTYSPVNENYPGWLFYASTNFGPSAHFRDELPLLNNYIRECQTILQNTLPDNDILLYFPIDDLWTKYPGDLLLLLDVHKYAGWFGSSPFGRTAKTLWGNGYSFDYVSDEQINQLTVNSEGKLSVRSKSAYSLLVVPPVEYIDKRTLYRLDSLARSGATIVFTDRLPGNFAGYLARNDPPAELDNLKKSLAVSTRVASDLPAELKSLAIRQEQMKMLGLDFIRKRSDAGPVYFITNLGDRFYEGSLSLAEKSDFIEYFDPQTLEKGFTEASGPVRLQLPPGKSMFINLLSVKPKSGRWQHLQPLDTICLKGEWTVRFISGNNQDLKPFYRMDSLVSWTGWGDERLRSFCGKAKYTLDFTIEKPDTTSLYQVSFDAVHESAAITVNGHPCGTIWSLPFTLDIPAGLLQKNNRMEIVVQNVSANYIREIDRQNIPWRKFYDINFVDIKYGPFNATNWQDALSGIIGRVMLIRQGRLSGSGKVRTDQ